MRTAWRLAGASLLLSGNLAFAEHPIIRFSETLQVDLIAIRPASKSADDFQPGAPTYSLNDCLRLALAQNPDVLAADKRLKAAQAGVIAARGAVYPALTSSGFYQRRDREVATSGDFVSNDRPDDYVADVRFTQNLYSAGSVRAQIAIAKMRAEAEALNYQAAIVSVALQVRLAFYQTLFSRENIDVQRQSVELLQGSLEAQQSQLKAGVAPEINVNRALVNLTNQLPALEQARFGLKRAYVLLSQLVVVPFSLESAKLPFRVSGTLDAAAPVSSLDSCLQRAQSDRPEIGSRQLLVQIADRQVTVEKAATRPQLSAFAAYDVFSENDQRSVRDNFSGYTVGISANWQIFDGFATRGRVLAARGQAGIAEANLAAIRQQVRSEVSTSYYDLLQAQATLKPQLSNIQLATEDLGIITDSLSRGIAGQLDLLQARAELTRARSIELGGRLQLVSAVARLRSAMGRADLPVERGEGAK